MDRMQEIYHELAESYVRIYYGINNGVNESDEDVFELQERIKLFQSSWVDKLEDEAIKWAYESAIEKIKGTYFMQLYHNERWREKQAVRSTFPRPKERI